MSNLLPHIMLLSGRDPKFSVIWLHGLGASGDDFVPIIDEIILPQAVRYIFPHAPKRPVSINGGFVMPAWYDIRSADIGGTQDEAGIRASQLEVDKLITHELERGIAADHIFLAGFSQGGAIALFSGLRCKMKLGGILALSTYLPLAETLNDEAAEEAHATPIFMAHGKHDPVVPYALGKTSAEELQNRGYALEWHEYPMQHTVSMEEIGAIEDWLKRQMAG